MNSLGSSLDEALTNLEVTLLQAANLLHALGHGWLHHQLILNLQSASEHVEFNVSLSKWVLLLPIEALQILQLAKGTIMPALLNAKWSFDEGNVHAWGEFWKRQLSVLNATRKKQHLQAGFEFYQKLGAQIWGKCPQSRGIPQAVRPVPVRN